MNCIFYAAIFPIGIIITVVGLFISYWSSKWWILNYCSLPKFSFRLGRHIVNIYITKYYRIIYHVFSHVFMQLGILPIYIWLENKCNLIGCIPFILLLLRCLLVYFLYSLEKLYAKNGC